MLSESNLKKLHTVESIDITFLEMTEVKRRTDDECLSEW